MREVHFRAILAKANEWSQIQNGVITMGAHECVHYLPVSNEARKFVDKEVPILHHFKKRFSAASLIGVKDVPYHTKTLRSQEPNPAKHQIKQDLESLNSWVLVFILK